MSHNIAGPPPDSTLLLLQRGCQLVFNAPPPNDINCIITGHNDDGTRCTQDHAFHSFVTRLIRLSRDHTLHCVTAGPALSRLRDAQSVLPQDDPYVALDFWYRPAPDRFVAPVAPSLAAQIDAWLQCEKRDGACTAPSEVREATTWIDANGSFVRGTRAITPPERR